MARENTDRYQKTVNPDLLASALAKAVAQGDIVNLRLLFAPFSPGRVDSTERFETEKYAYLLPYENLERDPAYAEALDAVKAPATWQHVQRELEARRPPQLPYELVLQLGDNAVRQGKYSSAAQAYELLRIRRKMLEIFLDEGDTALDNGDTTRAVRAYRIAAGLSYDYAAFPEPLPLIPDYQTEALKLHGVYPHRPEDCIALREPELHLNQALEYLLVDSAVASRLRERSHEVRLAFLKVLVVEIDPAWDEFVERYREACGLVQRYGESMRRMQAQSGGNGEDLKSEIQEHGLEDPRDISDGLLGHTIPEGDWWQYLKELAYRHPASALFVARQAIGEHEIIMPRLRAGSSLPAALELVDPSQAEAAATSV